MDQIYQVDQIEILLIVKFQTIDFSKIPHELFAKALEIFETRVLVNDNLCGKVISSLEFLIKFEI